MSILQELIGLNEGGFNFKLGDSLAEADIDDVLDNFIEYAIKQGMSETAAEDGPEDGTDYLVEKMEEWLMSGDYEYEEIEAFMDKYQSEIFEHIYAGLT